MTGQATDGSVTQGTASAGNPPAAAKTPETGSAGGEAKSWFDGLSEGNRKLAETKGWKADGGLDKLVSSYAEMEKLQGSSLRVPASDAPKEEWDKFHAKLGRPEAPDKYEFKRPDSLPENLPYSEELATAAKAWFHEAGLNPKQAQLVHDKWAQQMAGQAEAYLKTVAQNVEQTHAVLTKEWGAEGSEGFKKNHELANRAMKNLGLVEAYQKSGILLKDGSLTDPAIAKAFAKIGEAMFREDTIGNDPAAAGENPFKRDEKGSIKSVSKISTLIKSDPERAKRLAREAGEDLRQWFPDNPR